MKSEKLQFDRSLATDSEATYRLRTKSHLCLDAGIGGTFYSIPVDSYRNFRRILLYAAMRTISTVWGGPRYRCVLVLPKAFVRVQICTSDRDSTIVLA